MENTEAKERLMNRKDVAAFCQKTPHTIRRWVLTGKLAAPLYGGLWSQEQVINSLKRSGRKCRKALACKIEKEPVGNPPTPQSEDKQIENNVK